MTCFRNTTFCGSTCTNKFCDLHFSDDDWLEAKRTWEQAGDMTIVWRDFSQGCEGYRPPRWMKFDAQSKELTPLEEAIARSA